MTDHIAAASSLIRLLKAPPQAHSVYIRTDVNKSKQFRYTLCLSWNPSYTGPKVSVAEHMGFPVEQVPWPKDM